MTVEIHAPKNTKPITALYAVISVCETGEGICAGIIGNLVSPLVTADENNLPALRRAAKELARNTRGMDISYKLIKMTAREELEL